MISTNPAEKYTIELIKRFEIELRFAYVDELITEERALRYFKSMYIKHAFDAMGNKFKELYENQYNFVKKLKKEYKDKYGS